MSSLKIVLSSPEDVERFREIACSVLEREGELTTTLRRQLEQEAQRLMVHPVDRDRVLQDVLALPSVRAAIARREAAQRVSAPSQARDPVFERIKTIIIDYLGVEPENVTPEARFREDLLADSLDLVELVMALEEEFGCEIPDTDALMIRTVGEAVEYIKRRV